MNVMELPSKLKADIIEFLKSLPNISDSKSRYAFILEASLDRRLQDQISPDEPPAQFVPNLVDKLLKYGQLDDG